MYYLCSKNKGDDQLCSYRTADLRLCFRINVFFFFFFFQKCSQWLLIFQLPWNLLGQIPMVVLRRQDLSNLNFQVKYNPFSRQKNSNCQFVSSNILIQTYKLKPNFRGIMALFCLEKIWKTFNVGLQQLPCRKSCAWGGAYFLLTQLYQT